MFTDDKIIDEKVKELIHIRASNNNSAVDLPLAPHPVKKKTGGVIVTTG